VPPFVENNPGMPDDKALLFVGKLRSPGGNERLVFLDMKINLSGSRTGGSNAARRTEGQSSAEFEVRFGRKLEGASPGARGTSAPPPRRVSRWNGPRPSLAHSRAGTSCSPDNMLNFLLE
jgi:hypothetical protein